MRTSQLGRRVRFPGRSVLMIGLLVAAAVAVSATEAAAAKSCGHAMPGVVRVKAKGVDCATARKVAIDNSIGRRGCSGRWGSRCHGYRCDYKSSVLLLGETHWKMSCRAGSKRISYLYRQGGE